MVAFVLTNFSSSPLVAMFVDRTINAKIFKQRIIPKDSVICGLRCQSDFYNHVNPKSVHYGLETLRSLGPEIWNILPERIKSSAILSLFKKYIKTWIPLKCYCRLCKTFLLTYLILYLLIYILVNKLFTVCF